METKKQKYTTFVFQIVICIILCLISYFSGLFVGYNNSKSINNNSVVLAEKIDINKKGAFDPSNNNLIYSATVIETYGAKLNIYAQFINDNTIEFMMDFGGGEPSSTGTLNYTGQENIYFKLNDYGTAGTNSVLDTMFELHVYDDFNKVNNSAPLVVINFEVNTDFGENVQINNVSTDTITYRISDIYGYVPFENKSFIEEFLTFSAEVATSFGIVLVNATTAITAILWTGEGLTIVGASLAMALGVGAVYLIFRMVRGLIKQNDRG